MTLLKKHGGGALIFIEYLFNFWREGGHDSFTLHTKVSSFSYKLVLLKIAFMSAILSWIITSTSLVL